MTATKNFKQALSNPLKLVVLMWLVMLNALLMDLPIVQAGLYPRSLWGLKGIITAPFIHSNLEHLSSNTFPILFLGTMLYYFYPKISTRVILYIILITGISVWLFARPSYHIGASGLVYGLATFIFFSGVFRKDIRLYALSFIILFLYGGIVEGLMPNQIGVSWESHLAGAISGGILAYFYKGEKSPHQSEEIKLDDDGENEFKYRYRDE